MNKVFYWLFFISNTTILTASASILLFLLFFEGITLKPNFIFMGYLGSFVMSVVVGKKIQFLKKENLLEPLYFTIFLFEAILIYYFLHSLLISGTLRV